MDLFWFMDQKRIVPGSVSVFEDYSGFDPFRRCKFAEWVDYFIEEAKKSGTLCGEPWMPEIYSMFRAEELARVNDELLPLQQFEDADFYFLGTGQFDLIESTGVHWFEPVESVESDMGQPVGIRWEDLIHAFKQIEKKGYYGRGLSGIHIAAQVNQLAHGIRRYQSFLPNVLLIGAPGTGKELIARAIHHQTEPAGDFGVLNCAGLNPELTESELFGHKVGAFTGAVSDKPGMMEVYNKGTLFLDEIDKMSEEVQNKLLRALQEKEGRRVGSNESYEVDLLFVSAANEPNDIGSEPLRGRIAGIEIRMPTLLQRGEEIFLLVNKILERIGSNPADEYRFPLAAWCQTQVAHLTSNVRSLESLVLRQVYHFSNPSIELPDPKLDAFLSACRKVRDSGENPTLKNVGKALSYNGKKSFSKSHVSTAFRKECDVARAMGLLPPGRKRG